MSKALAIIVVILIANAHAATPTKVAVLAIRDPEGGAVIQRALTEAIQFFPQLALAPSAKEAKWTLAAELAPIGDGLIVYLLGTDASGRQIGSATVALASRPKTLSADEVAQLRAAVAKIFVPGQHTGKLALKVDVKGVDALVDGREVSTASPVELPVGTHTLRVTHPSYRDFLRFVDVEFGRTETVDVKLAAFPLSEGEMVERRKAQAAKTKPTKALPWYRRWYTMAAAGVVLFGATATITYFARPNPVDPDATRSFTPVPGP